MRDLPRSSLPYLSLDTQNLWMILQAPLSSYQAALYLANVLTLVCDPRYQVIYLQHMHLQCTQLVVTCL